MLNKIRSMTDLHPSFNTLIDLLNCQTWCFVFFLFFVFLFGNLFDSSRVLESHEV